MPNGNITRKQQEILEYMKQEILKKGYPPSVREICTAVDLRSTSSVHAHLEKLEKNGYIRRDPAKPRCIEIVDDTFQVTRREMAIELKPGESHVFEMTLAVEGELPRVSRRK